MATTIELNDNELISLINKHPHLKARIHTLFMIADAASQECEKADDIEMQLREHVRAMGQETLESWARSQEKMASTRMSDNKNVKKHTKKKFNGTLHLEK